MICDLANIRLKSLRPPTGFMEGTAKDPVALNRAREEARALRTDYVLIDEKGDLSINEFRSRARHAVIREKCELLMIDYLQRMKCTDKALAGKREQQINEIAQGISATAKELQVPIVVLAQLNRNPEDRPDGKPELGDLRESGSIEQEARFVGLLWRPKYYATNLKKRAKMMELLKITDDDEFDQYVECIVAKQNEGPSGPVPLRFIEDYARFESQDPERPMFSGRPDKRQSKREDPAADTLMRSVREVFPEATETEERMT
jgi:replicative DNA helicase